MRILMKLWAISLLIPTLALADRPEGEVVTFYLTDHLGTPVVAMDEAGEVLWTREYSAFGEALENEDDVQVGYTGHEFVPESGLSYMEARWYNPVISRFLQPDPVGFTANNTLSFNRYLYVNNSPYVAQDPDGEYLDVIVEIASISIGIASAIENFSQGNIKEGLADVAFAAADGVLMAVPGVPGGLGALRNAAKNADDVSGLVLTEAGKSARTPVGRIGQKTNFPNPNAPRPRNNPETIGGRDYSGHALDRMQERGYTPSVVENTIQHGTRSPGNRRGTTVHTDRDNNIRVVTDSDSGKVVTVVPGGS